MKMFKTVLLMEGTGGDLENNTGGKGKLIRYHRILSSGEQ